VDAANAPAGSGNKNVYVPSPGAGFSRPDSLPTLRPTSPPRRPSSTDSLPEVEPYPGENEIPDVNIRNGASPNANVPSSVEEDRVRDGSPRLNLG